MVNLKKHKLNESYIYYDFPFDNIYETSRKEASRKKPIFFIHKYFARRTTCNFRLMLLSMLISEINVMKIRDILERLYVLKQN